MKCFLYVLIFISAAFFETNAQSVAINTSGATANASSILDISSTSKGVLVPRMTKAQKNAIATPASGLLVYQGAPDSIGFHYYNGSLWIWLNPSSGGGNDWSLTGNAGTDTAINFIGTTDNMPLAFKVNNEKSGRIESDITTANTFIGNRSGRLNTGAENTAFGFRALSSNTSGFSNTAVGSGALENLSGPTRFENVAVGYNALQNSNGTYNVGIGAEALKQSTGNGNVAVGQWVLQNNTTGLVNTGMGYYALRSNVTGRSNIAVGMLSLYNNLSGSYNISIGDSASFSSTNVSHVIAIGSKALFANTSGTNLTALGDSALYSNTTGYKNISLGNYSLAKNTTGFQNIAIGHNTLKDNVAGFANIAIGDSALSANTTNWNIAIGRYALYETTTGDKNIAIGDVALGNNLTGTNNVAIGYASQNTATTNNKNNTSLGFRSAIGMQGYSNTIIGGDAMGKPAVSYTVNNTVAVGDSVLFNITTGASNNTAIGTKALFSNTSGRTNTVVGARALYDNTTGNYNVAVGDSAAANSSTLSHLVAVGSKALYTNTSGTDLTAIGDSALYSNTTGNFNTALGNGSLRKNTTGDDNVALGYKALYSSTAAFSNTAVGNNALFSVVSGGSNTAVGYGSLNKNMQSSNTAVGYNAMTESTTGFQNTAIGGLALENNGSFGNYNVAIGYATLQNNSGAYNIGIGNEALSQTSGNANIGIGHQNLRSNTTGMANVGLGYYALRTNSTGRTNIAIGQAALFDNVSGSYNVAVGDSAGYNNTVSNLVAIGSKALWNNTTGIGNTVVGYQSMYSNVTGGSNTAFGNSAGYLNTGSGNVFVGYNAGYNETGSNKLYIDNSATTTPLIFGDFTTNTLRVNGVLNINNDYTFPLTDGAANQVLYTNGAGALSWATASSESTTASNGLTLTGSNVALGGALSGNTAISYSNFNLTHSLNGTGNFVISTPTRPNAFTVLNSGDVAVNNNDFVVSNAGNAGINTSTPVHRLHIVNTVGGLSNLSNGAMIQNINTGATGQATLAFKNAGPDGLPGNRAWITGMNAFDNYAIAYGDSLTGTNAIVRVDTAGYVGINPSGPPTNRLDVVGSFGNAIRITTVSTTLDEDDHTVIIGPAAGSVTITLPTATSTARREYVIVNRSTSNQAVTSYNDFSGTSVFVAANSAITLQSNAVNWFRIR